MFSRIGGQLEANKYVRDLNRFCYVGRKLNDNLLEPTSIQ